MLKFAVTEIYFHNEQRVVATNQKALQAYAGILLPLRASDAGIYLDVTTPRGLVRAYLGDSILKDEEGLHVYRL